MGFLDDAKDKIEDLVEGHEKEISEGLDKAAGLIGSKVGHQAEIAQGVKKVKEALDLDES